MNMLIHLANVVYLLSYWVKGIKTLRVLTCLGIVLLIPYYLVQVEPLWAAAGWNLVFLGINIYRMKGAPNHSIDEKAGAS